MRKNYINTVKKPKQPDNFLFRPVLTSLSFSGIGGSRKDEIDPQKKFVPLL